MKISNCGRESFFQEKFYQTCISKMHKTHVKIFIILMKKNFQRCAVAHRVAFHMYILEVGSLLLWKFGLGCYTPFCSSLALRAAADGKHDVDSYNSRTE